MKKKFIAAALIVAGIGFVYFCYASPYVRFFIACMQDDRMSKEKIFDYVTQNQEMLESSVADETITKIKLPKGIQDVIIQRDIFDKINLVRFCCGGYGIGSETGYAGFYYLPSGGVYEGNMSALGYCGIEFFPKENAWEYRQSNGDNIVYIENITGNFYYYSEEY